MRIVLALVTILSALAAVASPRGESAAIPHCFLGGPANIRAVLDIKGNYGFSLVAGVHAGRPWRVCQYTSQDVPDPVISAWVGVFPFVGKFPERVGNVDEFCFQAFITALQYEQRACLLLRKAEAERDPERKIRLLYAALAKIGDVDQLTSGFAGNPAFRSNTTKGYGSDVWVYLRSSGALVHTHCIKAARGDPESRYDACAERAARAIVSKTVGKK